MVNKLISKFQLMMAVQSGRYNTVPVGDELLVYAPGYVNSFKTSLVARGPKAEVEAMLAELAAK